MFLKILQALQKNTCVVVTPTQVFSCDVCEILRKLTLKNICERLFHRFVSTRLLSSWTSLLLEWKSDSTGWVKTIFEKCLIMTFSHNFFTLLIPLYIFNICFPFFWKLVYFSAFLGKIEISKSFMKTTLTLCVKQAAFEKIRQVP